MLLLLLLPFCLLPAQLDVRLGLGLPPGLGLPSLLPGRTAARTRTRSDSRARRPAGLGLGLGLPGLLAGRTRTGLGLPGLAGRPDCCPDSPAWPLFVAADDVIARYVSHTYTLAYFSGVYHRVLRCSFTFPSPHYSADCKKKGRGRSSAKRDAKASPQDRKRAATSRSARAARTPLALAGPRCIRSFECTKILSEYETIVPARGLRMMACTIMNDAFMCYY